MITASAALDPPALRAAALDDLLSATRELLAVADFDTTAAHRRILTQARHTTVMLLDGHERLSPTVLSHNATLIRTVVREAEEALAADIAKRMDAPVGQPRPVLGLYDAETLTAAMEVMGELVEAAERDAVASELPAPYVTAPAEGAEVDEDDLDDPSDPANDPYLKDPAALTDAVALAAKVMGVEISEDQAAQLVAKATAPAVGYRYLVEPYGHPEIYRGPIRGEAVTAIVAWAIANEVRPLGDTVEVWATRIETGGVKVGDPNEARDVLNLARVTLAEAYQARLEAELADGPDAEDGTAHRELVTGVMQAITENQAAIRAELHDAHAVSDDGPVTLLRGDGTLTRHAAELLAQGGRIVPADAIVAEPTVTPKGCTIIPGRLYVDGDGDIWVAVWTPDLTYLADAGSLWSPTKVEESYRRLTPAGPGTERGQG